MLQLKQVTDQSTLHEQPKTASTSFNTAVTPLSPIGVTAVPVISTAEPLVPMVATSPASTHLLSAISLTPTPSSPLPATPVLLPLCKRAGLYLPGHRRESPLQPLQALSSTSPTTTTRTHTCLASEESWPTLQSISRTVVEVQDAKMDSILASAAGSPTSDRGRLLQELPPPAAAAAIVWTPCESRLERPSPPSPPSPFSPSSPQSFDRPFGLLHCTTTTTTVDLQALSAAGHSEGASEEGCLVEHTHATTASASATTTTTTTTTTLTTTLTTTATSSGMDESLQLRLQSHLDAAVTRHSRHFVLAVCLNQFGVIKHLQLATAPIAQSLATHSEVVGTTGNGQGGDSETHSSRQAMLSCGNQVLERPIMTFIHNDDLPQLMRGLKQVSMASSPPTASTCFALRWQAASPVAACPPFLSADLSLSSTTAAASPLLDISAEISDTSYVWVRVDATKHGESIICFLSYDPVMASAGASAAAASLSGTCKYSSPPGGGDTRNTRSIRRSSWRHAHSNINSPSWPSFNPLGVVLSIMSALGNYVDMADRSLPDYCSFTAAAEAGASHVMQYMHFVNGQLTATLGHKVMANAKLFSSAVHSHSTMCLSSTKGTVTMLTIRIAAICRGLFGDRLFQSLYTRLDLALE
ncbi:hypothetical protein BSLG_007247 [Batrachochytrium salamandrivorans]|nr:hypothetical protein BSLG_007247 [Batrachochytrium salamandrivorans]